MRCSHFTVERILLLLRFLKTDWCPQFHGPKNHQAAGHGETHPIPAFGRQKQADIYEFEASLVYQVSSRIAKACYTEKPCLKSPPPPPLPPQKKKKRRRKKKKKRSH